MALLVGFLSMTICAVSSHVIAPATPLLQRTILPAAGAVPLPATIGFAKAVPQNVLPFASQVSLYNRALSGYLSAPLLSAYCATPAVYSSGITYPAIPLLRNTPGLPLPALPGIVPATTLGTRTVLSPINPANPGVIPVGPPLVPNPNTVAVNNVPPPNVGQPLPAGEQPFFTINPNLPAPQNPENTPSNGPEVFDEGGPEVLDNGFAPENPNQFQPQQPDVIRNVPQTPNTDIGVLNSQNPNIFVNNPFNPIPGSQIPGNNFNFPAPQNPEFSGVDQNQEPFNPTGPIPENPFILGVNPQVPNNPPETPQNPFLFRNPLNPSPEFNGNGPQIPQNIPGPQSPFPPSFDTIDTNQVPNQIPFNQFPEQIPQGPQVNIFNNNGQSPEIFENGGGVQFANQGPFNQFPEQIPENPQINPFNTNEQAPEVIGNEGGVQFSNQFPPQTPEIPQVNPFNDNGQSPEILQNGGGFDFRDRTGSRPRPNNVNPSFIPGIPTNPSLGTPTFSGGTNFDQRRRNRPQVPVEGPY